MKKRLEAGRKERQQIREHELAMKKLELETRNCRREKTNGVTTNAGKCQEQPTRMYEINAVDRQLLAAFPRENSTMSSQICVKKKVDVDRVHMVEDEQERIPEPMNKRLVTTSVERTEICDSVEKNVKQPDEQTKDLSQGRIETEVEMFDKEESGSVTQQATENNATIQTKTGGQGAELSQERVNIQLHTEEEGGEIVASIQKTTEQNAIPMTVVSVQDQELVQNRPSVDLQMLDRRMSISSL
uniref:Uncharacterized protein LOC108950802 n=1 Tax=Phallusia mammillata TaxID=59560 RepID=A0A6F9DK29_9ASCI|nr:uncharacterized protein LOC108950802 [Phallusia mammillata]